MSEPGGRAALRWRPAAPILLAAGSLLVVVAIASRNPVPLFLALSLLLAPVLARARLADGTGRVRVDWSAEGVGPDLAISGSIEGKGEAEVRRLVLRFDRPEPIVESAAPETTLDGSRLRFRLHWNATYPLVAVVPRPSAIATDPIGLAERTVGVDGPELPLERFPPEASRIGSIPLRRTTPISGEVRSKATGRGGEFFSLRAAASGDTPRQINWRASARSGRLLANEHYLERTGDLLLVLDARPSLLGPKHDRTLLSIASAAAHGIAVGFLRQKTRVGLAVFGEFLEAVPLGSGRVHRYRIDRALLATGTSSLAGPSERLAVSLRRYFPPGVSTLLITPLADEASLELLAHLRRRGFFPAVLSPSPLPLVLPQDPENDPDDQLVSRLMRLVRRDRISSVWEEAPVLDWVDYWSLGGVRGLMGSPGGGARRW